MTTVNLGATTWTLAKTKLRLEVTASASLDAPDLLLKEDSEELIARDLWIHKGRNFHLSFHISFNNLLSEAGAFDEDAFAGFITSVLTQPSLWSQLHLVSSLSAPDPVVSECRVNGIALTLNLEQDGDLDSDLTNVKPPEAIPAISLASIQISLTFSSMTTAPKKPLPLSRKGSSEFEDLLGPEYDQELLELDLEIPDWQYQIDEALKGHVTAVEMLFHPPPTALLCEFYNQLESPSYLCVNPGSLYLPHSSFHSLEACDSIFSSQPSNLVCQLEEDMTFSDKRLILMTHERETSTTSSPLSTFQSLEPEDSSSCRSAEKQTAFSSSFQTICAPIPQQHTTVFHQPILSLTDGALRTLIHPQPTRLPAGIKLVDSHPSPEKTKRTALSSLAPSIFTPDYARAVVERAPLVPSIAKSLATFLTHRAGSGPCSADSQDGEDGKRREEDVKEILRGHVWMTMTNGLSISHREKARRLKPLMMPVQLREGGNKGEQMERIEKMELEMLAGAFVPRTSQDLAQGEPEEELEILEGFEQRGAREDADASEDELLFGDEEVDLSFWEEEFEELCLFERVVDGGGGGGRHAVLEECIVVDGDDDDHSMEEMLL